MSASSILEAYGVLQTNIAHGHQGAAIRAVAFTSALPGEGKTTSVANLALTLARRGLHVLLIDADLQRGMVHRVFGLPRQHGLADILQGCRPIEAVRHAVEVSPGGTLHVLTTGAGTTSSAGLLDSDAMRQLLERCREEHDVVIIDAPPVNVIADAVLVGRQADGVVIVARAGVTEAAALSYAIDQLHHVDAPVLGVVLNDIDFRKDAAYDPIYRYCDYGKYAAVK